MRFIAVVTQREAAGAQSAALRVCRGLRQIGHQSQTWFLYAKQPVYAGLPDTRTLLERPPRGPFDYLRLLVELTRALRRERPDAVVSFTQYANILAQMAAFMAGVRVRVASQRAPSTAYSRFARTLDHVLGTLGVYSKIVMVSQATDDSFAYTSARYRSRAVVVRNGTDAAPSPLTRAEARARFGLSTKRPLLVNVGRLSAGKNQAVLLRSLANLPSVELAICGDGELHESLRRLAQDLAVTDRVHLLGEIDPSEVPHLLAAADLFVFPSRSEGCSNALMEAMVAGLPVLAADVDANAEQLRLDDGELAAVLLPFDDDRAWTAAVARLLTDETGRSRLAALAKRRVRDFPIEQMLHGFEQCLSD